MAKTAALIVGSESAIGAALLIALRDAGSPVVGTTRRPKRVGDDVAFLDLDRDVSAWKPPAGISTAFVCAAITSQAACAGDPAGTARINVDRTLQLANTLVDGGTRVVFLSTNLVFDSEQPFVTADAPRNPPTEYGRQKAAVEEALLLHADRVCIVRLTKVLSVDSILADWARSLRDGKSIRPFGDLPVSPVPLPFAVGVLRTVCETETTGVLQVGASDELHYADVARHLAGQLDCDPTLIEVASASESNLDHIPRHASLDTSRLRSELGVTPPSSRETVDAVLRMMPIGH